MQDGHCLTTATTGRLPKPSQSVLRCSINGNGIWSHNASCFLRRLKNQRIDFMALLPVLRALKIWNLREVVALLPVLRALKTWKLREVVALWKLREVLALLPVLRALKTWKVREVAETNNPKESAPNDFPT